MEGEVKVKHQPTHPPRATSQTTRLLVKTLGETSSKYYEDMRTSPMARCRSKPAESWSAPPVRISVMVMRPSATCTGRRGKRQQGSGIIVFLNLNSR